MTETLPRAILVTGASTGIGAASVRALAQAGFLPIAMVRKQPDLEALRNNNPGLAIEGVIADVVDWASLEAAAATVKQLCAEKSAGGQLWGLVNNAGIAVPGTIMHQPMELYERTLNVNVLGVVRCIKLFGPLLGAVEDFAGEPGRIVNMSSVAGQVAWPFTNAYVASKHAVEGLTDSARRELTVYGVDAVAIGPGTIATPIWEKSQGYDLGDVSGTYYERLLSGLEDHLKQANEKGLPVERVADLVVEAFAAKNPKPRRAPVPDPVSGWLLFRVLPRRWADALMANAMGLKRPK